jgi:hypothetical protein
MKGCLVVMSILVVVLTVIFIAGLPKGPAKAENCEGIRPDPRAKAEPGQVVGYWQPQNASFRAIWNPNHGGEMYVVSSPNKYRVVANDSGQWLWGAHIRIKNGFGEPGWVPENRGCWLP